MSCAQNLKNIFIIWNNLKIKIILFYRPSSFYSITKKNLSGSGLSTFFRSTASAVHAFRLELRRQRKCINPKAHSLTKQVQFCLRLLHYCTWLSITTIATLCTHIDRFSHSSFRQQNLPTWLPPVIHWHCYSLQNCMPRPAANNRWVPSTFSALCC